MTGSQRTCPWVSGPMPGGDRVPGDVALGVRTWGGGDGVPVDLALGVRTWGAVMGSQGTWPWVSGPGRR